MKGRTLIDSFLAQTVPMSLEQEESMRKVKLLSARGCDSIVYTEDERATSRSLSPAEVAFYKSLPEWNEGSLECV